MCTAAVLYSHLFPLKVADADDDERGNGSPGGFLRPPLKVKSFVNIFNTPCPQSCCCCCTACGLWRWKIYEWGKKNRRRASRESRISLSQLDATWQLHKAPCIISSLGQRGVAGITIQVFYSMTHSIRQHFPTRINTQGNNNTNIDSFSVRRLCIVNLFIYNWHQ